MRHRLPRGRSRLLMAALILVACIGTAWAQFTGGDHYDPFQYSKDPARWKAPPVPKPYSEDKQNRYYTLVDFKANDKNLRAFVRDKDQYRVVDVVQKKHQKKDAKNPAPRPAVASIKDDPIMVDGKPAKFSLVYLERGDLENFVEYWLAGRFKTFECTLMVPDNFNGKLYYYVFGDDKKLLQGDDLGPDRKTAHITLSVEGVRRLVLKTSGAASTENVRIVWANPILTETKDDE